MPEENTPKMHRIEEILLLLSGPFAETRIRFIEMEGGPRPRFGVFNVRVAILHSSNGTITYEADDLYFSCEVFRDFLESLQVLSDRQEVIAELKSVGRTFVMRVYEHENQFREEIEIREFMGIGEEDVTLRANLTVGNNNVLREWSEEIEYFINNIQVWYRGDPNSD